jgi:hypothetical protein
MHIVGGDKRHVGEFAVFNQPLVDRFQLWDVVLLQFQEKVAPCRTRPDTSRSGRGPASSCPAITALGICAARQPLVAIRPSAWAARKSRSMRGL